MAARYRRSALGLDYLFDERVPLAAILALARPFPQFWQTKLLRALATIYSGRRGYAVDALIELIGFNG